MVIGVFGGLSSTASAVYSHQPYTGLEVNMTRTVAPVSVASRPQFRPAPPEWPGMSLSSAYSSHPYGLSSRVSTRFAGRSKRVVPPTATPSPENQTRPTREQVITLIKVSPFIDAVVLPALLGVTFGYFGMAVAEVGQSFTDTRVGVAFILVVDIFSLTLFLLIGVATATVQQQHTELSVNQSVTEARFITVTNSGISVVLAIEPVVAVCGDDISKFSPFVRARFQISENAQVTIKATMQDGCEIDLQDQVKADISLSDFLRSTSYVVVERLKDG